jgi:outer membrane protein assembly factor BamB
MLTRFGLVFVCAAALLFAITTAASAADWPRFRGPTGMGLTAERNLPVTWGGPDGANILWQTPVVGEGHASPVIWGDKVFVASVRWADGAKRDEVIPEHHVACYSMADGRRLWDTLVPPGPWLRTDFRSGPGGGYAAATPATDGERVYVAFASSVLAAIDMGGRIVWRNVVEPYTFDVTLASSPVLFGKNVILFCAMAKPEDSRVVAFDAATGRTAWNTPLAGTAFGHATPVIIEAGGGPQMLLAASGMKESPTALQSVDPRDGRLLWHCRGAADVSSPVAGAGLVYFDSGRGGPGTALDPTAAPADGVMPVRWTTEHVPESLSSPVVVGPHLFRLVRPGSIRFHEMATGNLVKTERLDGLGTLWASPIVDPDGRVFYASGGKSYVVETSPEFRILGTSDLGDMNHASPAAAGGRLVILGMKRLYCIGEKAK